MIPKTIHGLTPHDCISAMQKFIRRGMEREAMEVACEMGHTSKGFATWVAGRLEVISHEDVGLAAPEVITLVRTCVEQAKEWWEADRLGKWRMPIGTAIRALCRAPKSREGDHFQAAVGLPLEIEDRRARDPRLGLRPAHAPRQGQGPRAGLLPQGVDATRAGAGRERPLRGRGVSPVGAEADRSQPAAARPPSDQKELF